MEKKSRREQTYESFVHFAADAIPMLRAAEHILLAWQNEVRTNPKILDGLDDKKLLAKTEAFLKGHQMMMAPGTHTGNVYVAMQEMWQDGKI